MHLYRALARLTASVLLAGALAAPALAVTGTVDTEDSYLRMRAEANTTSAILKQLAHGTQVEILSALENECSKSQFISSVAAVQDLLLCQPVSAGMEIPPPNAAVIAVISAIVRKLDQPSGKDLISVIQLTEPDRFPRQHGAYFRIAGRFQKPRVLFPGQSVITYQFFRQNHAFFSFLFQSALKKYVPSGFHPQIQTRTAQTH